LAALAISTALPQLALARTRTLALKVLGIRLGAHALVLGPLRITGTGDVRTLLSFGSDTIITGPLHIDLGGAVRIGNQVYIGHNVVLLTVDHTVGAAERRCAEPEFHPITIGDGAWLGAHAIVLPGVAIGAGSVVGAGAVVTRDVPPNVVVAGVPARVLRRLDDLGGPSSSPDDTPLSVPPPSVANGSSPHQ
jgi:acetyltransferase-like isoleucine patch superfamily enzyme